MRRYDKRQTDHSFAKRVAAEHGVTGSGKKFNDFIWWVMWEKTGFPAFFMTDPWIVDFDNQLTEYFVGVIRCGRCGRQKKADADGNDPVDDGGFNLCNDCEKIMELEAA
jgi:hypothetical protein